MNECNKSFYRVFLKGITWLRDSHGLFDYESRNIQKRNMKTQLNGKIIRIENDLDFMALTKKEESNLFKFTHDVKPILEIKEDNSNSTFSYDCLQTSTLQRISKVIIMIAMMKTKMIGFGLLLGLFKIKLPLVQ